MERSSGMKDGFSLIEVIVAVAILAILSVPILLYFTNSAIHSAQGKHEQMADMAAQSVVEEVDSMLSFDSLEENASLMGWQLLSKASDPAGVTSLRRTFSVNGTDYVADVSLDYGDETYQKTAASPSPPPKAKYNTYQNPHLSEIYTEGSIVISEPAVKYDLDDGSGTSESLSSYAYNTGISDIYNQINGTPPVPTGSTTVTVPEKVPMETIRANTKREFHLQVTNDPGYPDTMFAVRVWYHYSYSGSGEPKLSDVTLLNTRIEKSKLKNFYFMFQPIWAMQGHTTPQNEEEDMVLKVKDLTTYLNDHEDQNVSVSLIKQNVNDIPDVSTTYTIHLKSLDGTAVFPSNMQFYGSGWKDGSTTKGVSIPEAANYETDPTLLRKSVDKRIARVIVKVYYADGFNPSAPGDPLTTLETSKSV